MKSPVIGAGGKPQGEVDLPDNVFGVEVSEGAIYHAIRNELANRRIGTASTKGRSEVSGSNRKPWRQKGTGRARAGDRKSPIWVGGGTIFGPRPRSYRYKLPRKAKRAALRSVLTQKLQADQVTVIDGITCDSGKTKELYRVLEPITKRQRSVWLLDHGDEKVVRAGRNIPWLRVCAYNTVTVHDLFYSDRVLLSSDAARKLGELFGGGGVPAEPTPEPPKRAATAAPKAADAAAAQPAADAAAPDAGGAE